MVGRQCIIYNKFREKQRELQLSPSDLCTQEKYDEWYAEFTKDDESGKSELDRKIEELCGGGRVVAKVTQRSKYYQFMIAENKDLYKYEYDDTHDTVTYVYYLYEYSGADLQESHAYDDVYTMHYDNPCETNYCVDAIYDGVEKYVETYNKCIDKLDDPGSWQDFGHGFGQPSEGIFDSTIGDTGNGGGVGRFRWSEFNKPPDLDNGATGVRACVYLKISETGQERKETRELRVFHWGDKFEPPYKNVCRRLRVESEYYEDAACTLFGCSTPTAKTRVWDGEEKSYSVHYDIQFLEYVFD